MKILLAPCLGLLLALPASGQQLNRYRIDAPNAQELATTLERSGFDVLEGSVSGSSLEVIASDEWLEALRARGLSPVLLEVGRPFRDVQAERGEEWDLDVPTGYANLEQIYAQMQDAAASFPGICQFVNLTARYGTPTTFEGRSLFAVKISDNVGVEEDEPAMLVVSNHHCREIVTPVIALEAIARLTQDYASDPDIQAIVDGYEIWIAPTWNPDGYAYVFNVNQNWRKNRRVFANGVGVDINRNYEYGWSSGCAGSTIVSSETYKGPSPSSEPETQTMIALSNDVRFAKVIDYHSSGRETLWEYACTVHPFAAFMQDEAIALSQASGYGSSNRPPSANGEHYEWQVAYQGANSYLIETHSQFQPSFASAQAEAAQLWPGIQYFLEEPIPAWGYVTDAQTGQPVAASLFYAGFPLTNGEVHPTNPDTGRYHAFLPPGDHRVTFFAPGYREAHVALTVTPSSSERLDVKMVPLGFTPTATVATRTGMNNVDTYVAEPPVMGTTIDLTVTDTMGYASTQFYAFYLPDHTNLGFLTGTVLVETASFQLFRSPVIGGSPATHQVAIPIEVGIGGFTTYTQALLFNGETSPALTNAQDLTVGTAGG